jgi:hypothetical protein
MFTQSAAGHCPEKSASSSHSHTSFFSTLTSRLSREREGYPCNRLWRPIGLWYVEASRQKMAVRLRVGRPLPPPPPVRFLILISVRGWVDPRAIVRLEGLGQLKKSNYLIGNRTCDLPACSIVPQRLNQLRHSLPPFTSGSLTKIVYEFIISPTHSTCPINK